MSSRFRHTFMEAVPFADLDVQTLTLLDYCLHAGSENVVIYFRDNVYLVKTLKEFQYIDEDGKDQGANVRQKAKDITNLLQDESRLRQERRTRASMRDRMTKGGSTSIDEPRNENVERRREQPQPSSSRKNRDEDELKKAMEASKQTFEQEAGKAAEYVVLCEKSFLPSYLNIGMLISSGPCNFQNRKNAIARRPSKTLILAPYLMMLCRREFFYQLCRAFIPTLIRNGAQASPFPLVDTGLQPQFTQLQPQFTSFNPYLQAQQEQQQQAMMQAQWANQQAEWQAAQQAAAQQEWARQQAEQQQLALQNEWARQQAEQQQLAAQNEWAMQQQAQQNAWLQQQQQQQQLFAQPTGFGSNNPFALGQGTSSPPPMPTLPSISSPAPSANNQQQYQQPSPSPTPSSSQVPQVKARQDENSALAALFANRDGGVDTFGNFGNLRSVLFSSFLNHSYISHRLGPNAGRLYTNPTGSTQSGNPYGQQRAAGSDQPFFSV